MEFKRFTKRDEYGNADITGVDSEDLQLNLQFDELNRVTDALNRLAAYEDIKLEPEEIKCILNSRVVTLAKGQVIVDEDAFNACIADNNRLSNELDRYKKWVNDLQAGMYVNCVYCGHRYGPEDKVLASMADALKEHIEKCPKHPISKLKDENEQLKTRIADIKIFTESIFRDINESDKVFIHADRIKALCGTYGENATNILLGKITALRIDKEQQESKIMKLEEALQRISNFDAKEENGYLDEWEEARAFDGCKNIAQEALEELGGIQDGL